MTYLEELRARPHEERVAIATFAAVATIGLLLVLWVVTLFMRVNTTDATQQTTPVLSSSEAAAAYAGFSKALNTPSLPITDPALQAAVAAEAQAHAQNPVYIYVDENGEVRVVQQHTP